MAVCVSSDEEELCAWLDRHPDAITEAYAARRRWLYIGLVADAAVQGEILDRSLLPIYTSPQEYALKARKMVAALEAWLGPALIQAEGPRYIA